LFLLCFHRDAPLLRARSRSQLVQLLAHAPLDGVFVVVRSLGWCSLGLSSSLQQLLLLASELAAAAAAAVGVGVLHLHGPPSRCMAAAAEGGQGGLLHPQWRIH
jgi:hypothetical protein